MTEAVGTFPNETVAIHAADSLLSEQHELLQPPSCSVGELESAMQGVGHAAGPFGSWTTASKDCGRR